LRCRGPRARGLRLRLRLGLGLGRRQGSRGRVGGGGLRRVGAQCAEAERDAAVRWGSRAGEGGGRGGERQPAARGKRRGERAEEEGGLERAHGGDRDGGRAAPARREARDLEERCSPFSFVYPFSLWRRRWVSVLVDTRSSLIASATAAAATDGERGQAEARRRGGETGRRRGRRRWRLLGFTGAVGSRRGDGNERLGCDGGRPDLPGSALELVPPSHLLLRKALWPPGARKGLDSLAHKHGESRRRGVEENRRGQTGRLE
jgi:hypothetical protein